MDLAQLETEINAAWDNRDAVNAATTGAVRDAVAAALALLDSGTARVAEPAGDHQWTVNQWLKKAVLLSFRLNDMQTIPSGTIYEGAGESVWWDKVPPKFSGWDEARFRDAGFPRRAGLYCSPFGLYCAKCRLDAKLCESWCLCWQRNNG
jgi:2,3,4,5-tetrahydropyridine-2-carboxylate N-succinyltransferase